MQIAHIDTTPVTPVRAVRGGTIKFQRMLEGLERSPNNFQLLVADTDISFKSPRHRHNFEQLRISLKGDTNIGAKQNIVPGDVVYFPEGTYYGPQDQESVGAPSAAMVIQFGGPSGNGYMSQRQLHEGFDLLQAHGRFEDGVFVRHSPAADGRKKQDAYEAIWEQQNDRAIAYPRAKFTAPVHFRNEHFEWRPVAGQPGVATRHLGTFELDTRIYGLQLQPGTVFQWPAGEQEHILFVRAGAGTLAPGGEWRRHSAIHLAAGDAADMRAAELADVLVVAMPRLQENRA